MPLTCEYETRSHIYIPNATIGGEEIFVGIQNVSQFPVPSRRTSYREGSHEDKREHSIL